MIDGEGVITNEQDIMSSIKRVIDYSGMDYKHVLELPTDVFLLMLKNSIVNELESTEEGRDYLDECKCLQETKPDRMAIHKLIKGV